MVLSEEAVAAYRRDGFFVARAFVPVSALDRLLSETPAILARESPRQILERDGRTVRSVYGPHQTSPVVAEFGRLPALAGAAMDLIGEGVYIHQSKINVKASFTGDQWEWHQDYIYWLRDDGIRAPNLVNAAVFLDEVTQFNGPLTLIPGSHTRGVLAVDEKDGQPAGYEEAPGWVSTLTADEKYGVREEVIEELARAGGMVSPMGPAGTVLFFHPNILHASVRNISPYSRRTLIVVYNGVSNPATNTASPRPEFLAARDFAPVVPSPVSSAATPAERPVV
jgi:ectoine hydroxylase